MQNKVTGKCGLIIEKFILKVNYFDIADKFSLKNPILG